MKTFLLLSFFLSIIFNYSKAQTIIEWQNTIGGSSYDVLNSVIQTTDGGFLLGGWSGSGVSGDKSEASQGDDDYWVVKLDGSGNILWQNTIGGNDIDDVRSVIETTDGGYLIGGYSYSGISGDKTEANEAGDYWVVKLDGSGNILWQNTVGGNEYDILRSAIQTADDGYLLGGDSDSGISGDKTEVSQGNHDYWVVKLDGSGNILWQNTIGGNAPDILYSVIQTTDGGYLLGGKSASPISGDKTEPSHGLPPYNYDYWVVKLDGSGNILWQNTIGGNAPDVLSSVIQTTDGGYLLGGDSESGETGDKTEVKHGDLDYWVVKLDGLGNILWQNTIGGNDYDALSSVIQTTDDGYLLGGYSASPISGDKTEASQSGFGDPDYWVVKLDGLGNILWQNTIGGNDYDQLYSVIQTTDDDYLLGGYSESGNSGDKTETNQGFSDYWVVKLTEDYNLINGKLYFDSNSNLVQDAGEPNLSYHKVIETNTDRFAFSEQNGFYSISIVDTGNYSVTPDAINYYSAVPASHNAYFSGVQQIDSLNDFAFQPDGVFNDLAITVTPLDPFRPGFDASYSIDYTNVGTTSLAGIVIFYPDANISYVSASVTPDQITADSIVWNTAMLTPFQFGSILVTVNVSTSAVIGSSISSSSTIYPIDGDADPLNNHSSWDVIVTGSFDPNDILVNIDSIYTTELATPSYLEYIINFQNTGTDTAFNVKVFNPISDKLDFTTFDFITSSHPINLSYNEFSQRIEFVFDNILLPDSNINEPESHGFIRYKIKPVTTLSAGDSIINNASIFFDFNAPIITNDAVTEIVLPIATSTHNLSNFKNDLEVFPNPATQTVTIKSQKQITGEAQWMVYDIVGREVYSAKSKDESSLTVDLSDFANGLYFIQLHSKQEDYRATMVKQ